MKQLRKFWDFWFGILSGEWLLWFWGNSGFIVLVRSLQVSLELFGIALLIKSWLVAGPGSTFSWLVARQVASQEFEWLGAIFAGCYAAFYSRFSGQWSYLAGLYNQIMSVKCGIEREKHASNVSLVKWQIGFIADAHTVHLDRKDLFASVIVSMLNEPEVFRQFKATLDSDDVQSILKHVGFEDEPMSKEETQKRIQDLADFPVNDEAAWLEKVKAEPTEVVAGAILKWQGGPGVSNGPDTKASRRESAKSLLESRFTTEITSTLNKLDASAQFVAWVGVGVGVVGLIVAFL